MLVKILKKLFPPTLSGYGAIAVLLSSVIPAILIATLLASGYLLNVWHFLAEALWVILCLPLALVIHLWIHRR